MASIAKLTASMASFLCSEDAAITTLGSFTGTILYGVEGGGGGGGGRGRGVVVL